jgi:hypothetical protein
VKKENHNDVYALFVVVVVLVAFCLGNTFYRIHQRHKCIDKWASMECSNVMGTRR